MKVKEIMTGDAKVCELNASLADAAKTMWENDCGALPVLKDGREVVGLITDRDICMGMAMRDANPSETSVEEVMTGALYSVTPETDIQEALKTMQVHKVRRLPVLNRDKRLVGIISLGDIAQAGGKKTDKALGEISRPGGEHTTQRA